jgi:hypothetical protein
VGEVTRVLKKVGVACFTVQSQHFPGGTEENHGRYQPYRRSLDHESNPGPRIRGCVCSCGLLFDTDLYVVRLLFLT